MEYGLWPPAKVDDQDPKTVLILVLMEYGLWHLKAWAIEDEEEES